MEIMEELAKALNKTDKVMIFTLTRAGAAVTSGDWGQISSMIAALNINERCMLLRPSFHKTKLADST